jgi:ATP-binding cassette subfamily F protein uup
MEARILEAERRLEACGQAAHDPAVASDHKVLHERIGALASAQSAVDELYARWAELEAKVKD